MRSTIFLSILVATLCGCAHTIQVTSTPPGALATLADGESSCTTPCQMDIPIMAYRDLRGHGTVTLTKEGYAPVAHSLTMSPARYFEALPYKIILGVGFASIWGEIGIIPAIIAPLESYDDIQAELSPFDRSE